MVGESGGRAESFADSKPAYIRERWRRVELAIHGGLEMHGMRDAFRAVRGSDVADGAGRYRDGSYSHLISRRSKPAKRRRLDHTFASTELEVIAARYDTGVLEAAGDNGHSWSVLSDHAPMVVGFAL